MKKFNSLKRVCIVLSTLILLNLIIVGIFSKSAYASKIEELDSPGWNIQLRPNVLFGSDGRVLYVMDMNIPLYRGENNLLFAAPKYTPNNESSWELNLGLGYRHILFDDSLMLGINAFYDYRKTPWGTKHTQWGVGAELMAEFNILEDGGGLGLTGRFNYYQPLTDAIVEITPKLQKI